MGIKFANNASSTLAVGISTVATSLTVNTGDGALFPAAGGSDWFYCTLIIAASNTREIVKVTSRTGDVFTITRAQEGTTGTAFSAGDLVRLQLTAAALNEFAHVTANNTWTGTNQFNQDISISGNVGIGTSSPGAKLDVYSSGTGTIVKAEATTGFTFFRQINSGGTLDLCIDNSTGSTFGKGNYSRNLYSTGAYPLVFWTNGTERLRIDSSGLLCINTTSAFGDAYQNILIQNSVRGTAIVCKPETNATINAYVFQNNSGGTAGYIQYTSTTTTYATSSDYRAKENIAPMTGALEKVAQLKPCTYTWKANGSDGQGFIAHELQAVVPDCVTGEKDAVDEDGNPVYQGIDTSYLVATLTAAIQEQQAMIAQLKARLDAANL